MRRLLAATMTLALTATVAPPVLADEAASLGQPANNPWSNVRAWETAIVERVVDGDTVIVNDEVTGAQSRVRLLGINAPEKPTKKKPGNCGGEQASQWLTALLPVGTRVRLLSSDRASTGKKKRPQRVVLAYNDATGDFDQDVAWGMAERGWGLWFTVPSEASMSSLYRAAIEGAQANRRGMWDPQLCGAIEQPDASLSLRISRGNGNVADETVTVRNTGGTTVDLTGWMLRDAGNAGWYTFLADRFSHRATTAPFTPARDETVVPRVTTCIAIGRRSCTSTRAPNRISLETAPTFSTVPGTIDRGASTPAPCGAPPMTAPARWSSRTCLWARRKESSGPKRSSSGWPIGGQRRCVSTATAWIPKG